MIHPRLSITCLTVLAAALLPVSIVLALVDVQKRGNWPKDWPAELEPMRASSRTIAIMAGIQETVYEIPVSDRQSFDAIWPTVRKLVTSGATLTLYRKSLSPPKGREHFLSNEEAAIRIYAPPEGSALGGGAELAVGPPWPESIVRKNDELPQYVIAQRGDDGRLTWVAADPKEKSDKLQGFYVRACIDVDLVIDGTTIDLNQVELPKDVRIVDHRFDDD